MWQFKISRIDRAGIVGADGQTHQGAFDLSFMRCIPNMTIMTPSDENEMRQMLFTAYSMNTPTAVRYPRGNAQGVALQPMQALEVGKGRLIREGKKVAILNFGTMLHEAQIVAEHNDYTLADMRFVKPIDGDLITQLADSHDLLVTIEENAIQGGAGSAVNEYLQSFNKIKPLAMLGIPDYFIPQATQPEAYAEIGLNAEGIEQKIQALLR